MCIYIYHSYQRYIEEGGVYIYTYPERVQGREESIYVLSRAYVLFRTVTKGLGTDICVFYLLLITYPSSVAMICHFGVSRWPASVYVLHMKG